jgi:hypothetical protein
MSRREPHFDADSRFDSPDDDASRPDPSDTPHAPAADRFLCTVHGVCFENRWRKLGELAKGDPLYLQREHGSRIDANAIRVMDPRVDQLGYMPAEIARWLAPLIDRGRPTLARVHRVSREDIPYYERLVIAVEVR